VDDFRLSVRNWLAQHLAGEFASLVGTGGPGREHEHIEARRRWERELGAGGWIGLGWPAPDGGGADIGRQVTFFEEYARAGGPGRLSHIGEYLLAPTLIAYGTPQQRERFLPPIRQAKEFWCQGYSEPDAGSDLAAVRTSAVLDGEVWRITGQKVWTSLAHIADWCFVLARTDPTAPKHRGLSYLLVPMDQPGVRVRPIVQLTGTSEFNEVFFDDAVTAAENVVGAPGDGWRVATGTLGFERGVATLGQQLGFARELDEVIAGARSYGSIDDPVRYDRIVDAWVGLQVLRHHALRTLGTPAGDPTGVAPGVEASVAKLLWAPWHQRLGELAMAVAGAESTIVPAPPYDLSDAQRLFLYTRADTIYGGSNEIQRNIIANHVLGRVHPQSQSQSQSRSRS
jgi:alkylation response protein AidB-like acyl-CoA dehydrogenase